MSALRKQHVNEMVAIVESALHQSAHQPLEVALHQIVRAYVAAHAINPMLHQVLNEQVPRLNASAAEAKIITLLRAFLK